MPHKLRAEFRLPHGIANVPLISNVIRYKAAEIPTKRAAFSQHDRPLSVGRYAMIVRHLDLGTPRS